MTAPSRCQHCSIVKKNIPHKQCQICQDQGLLESFLCSMHNQQEKKEAFVCHAFQANLSLVGKSISSRQQDIINVCADKATYFTEIVDNILYGKCRRNGGCGECGDKNDNNYEVSKFHIVWNVHQRRSLFSCNESYLSFLHDAFLTCGALIDGRIVLLWLAPDHLHFYLEISSPSTVGEIIEDLQGLIHDALVDQFDEIRDIVSDDSLIWEPSYFLESID